MLSRKVFDDGVEELLVGFPNLDMTSVRADLWYKYSKHLTDRQWQGRVDRCIKLCIKAVPVLADILDERGYYKDDYFRA